MLLALGALPFSGCCCFPLGIRATETKPHARGTRFFFFFFCKDVSASPGISLKTCCGDSGVKAQNTAMAVSFLRGHPEWVVFPWFAFQNTKMGNPYPQHKDNLLKRGVPERRAFNRPEKAPLVLSDATQNGPLTTQRLLWVGVSLVWGMCFCLPVPLQLLDELSFWLI